YENVIHHDGPVSFQKIWLCFTQSQSRDWPFFLHSELLASQQGGVAASLRKRREATEADADGVVFHSCPIGKPPRPRDQRRLRDILFDRSATPPCGDARRGMALLENGLSSAIRLVAAVLTLASVSLSQTPTKVSASASNVAATPAAYQEMLNKYCITCHNEKAKIPAGAPLALDKANLNDPGAAPEVGEKVVRKLGVGAMPPRNSPTPGTTELHGFRSVLITSLDNAAAQKINPG